MRVYLSGPMTGLAVGESRAWALEARRRLQAAGYEVYSPIEVETAGLPDDYVIPPENTEGNPLGRREVFFHFDRNEIHRSEILFVNVTPLRDDRYTLGSDWEMCWAYEFSHMIVLVARPDQAYAKHGFIKACGALIYDRQEDALEFLESYARLCRGECDALHRAD